MTNHLSPNVPQSNRFVSTLPLESLIRMVVSSDDAVEGLRAMAIELGGRDGGAVAKLADRLRRGEAITDVKSQPPDSVSLLQASTPDEAISSGGLPRWVMLDDQRSRVRHKLRRIVWFGLGGLLAATLAGLWLFDQVTGFLGDLNMNSNMFDWERYDDPVSKTSLLTNMFRVGYGSFAVTAIFLIAIWAIRGISISNDQNPLSWRSKVIRLSEAFWNVFPFIGATYRAMDLAQMSESIFLSLSAHWTYPQAFIAAAGQTKSAILRRWLLASVSRLERGDSVDSVVLTCPLRANWLAGMSHVLSTSSTDNLVVSQWRAVSDRLHQLMISRGRRAFIVITSASILVSTSILIFSWSHSMKLLFDVIIGAIRNGWY